jgi:site-specific DNA recombinase
MTPEPQKKAAGYIRVSTPAQAREGESLQTQKDSVASYCKGHGLELVNIFADEGISGRKQDRPGLTNLLRDAAQKKFDYVIVTRLTRFGRSARDLVGNLGILDDHAVRFISLKENIDTSTPAGRLLRTVLIGIAEFESEVIKDQMLENRQIRARRGDIIVGKPPYGYTWNRGEKRFEINPQEAEVYKRIVDMYLDGSSYLDITICLRREGIKAKLAPFSSPVVGNLLKNPVYYSGRLLRNTHKFAGNRKLKDLKPADQHFEISLPPLIEKSTWDRVQERIAFNKVKTKRTANPNFWLRNLLVCGECGGTIKPKSIRGRFDYYTCYWADAGKKILEAAGKKRKCPLPNIPAQDLQDVVEHHLLHYLTFGGFTIGGKYAQPGLKYSSDRRNMTSRSKTVCRSFRL